MSNPQEALEAEQAEPSPAQQVADAVLAVDGVTALHGGSFGEVATYLPGRSVSGIKLTDDLVSVHVVVAFGHDLRQVAGDVRRAAAAVVPAQVEVVVEDVVPAP